MKRIVCAILLLFLFSFYSFGQSPDPVYADCYEGFGAETFPEANGIFSRTGQTHNGRPVYSNGRVLLYCADFVGLPMWAVYFKPINDDNSSVYYYALGNDPLNSDIYYDGSGGEFKIAVSDQCLEIGQFRIKLFWNAPYYDERGEPIVDLGKFNIYSSISNDFTRGSNIINVVTNVIASPSIVGTNLNGEVYGEQYSTTVVASNDSWYAFTVVDIYGNESEFSESLFVEGDVPNPPARAYFTFP